METTKELTAKLNSLLASYQVHYQNLRGLHWNIKGAYFFELHTKYEELYLRTQDIIDEIAERILAIEGTPLHTYTDYLKQAKIKENATIHEGATGMDYLVSAQKELINLEREILRLSDELADEGTNALMSDLIREKEKTTWMFTSWLNKK
jgi:starvation-inducible DNA-binding protein